MTVVQPASDMVGAVVQEMKTQNLKNIGFIGFSDSWGDLVYNNGKAAAEKVGITIVTNERYARADTSVSAQVLKVVAAKPDGVLNGGSGTGGALPYTALAERGYKGPIFGTPALINPDFVRLAGAAGEGTICSTGPVMVASQLPDTNPSKKIGLAFKDAHQKANGVTLERRLLGLFIRCLADPRRCRQTRLAESQAWYSGVPCSATRRHLFGQGTGRHARRLQFQRSKPLWYRQARARIGEAREWRMDIL